MNRAILSGMAGSAAAAAAAAGAACYNSKHMLSGSFSFSISRYLFLFPFHGKGRMLGCLALSGSFSARFFSIDLLVLHSFLSSVIQKLHL